LIVEDDPQLPELYRAALTIHVAIVVATADPGDLVEGESSILNLFCRRAS
jgi:hypothetical protein